MEFRGVFISDIHFSLRAPESRKETYGQEILEKLNFVIDFANKKGAYIFIAGDIFHYKSNVSDEEKIALMKVLRRANMLIYGIVGSHDLSGYQLESINRRAIGVLQEAGLFTILNDKVYFENGNICVSGANVCKDYESTNPYSVKKGKEKIRIHLTHGMLLDEKDPRFDCTTLSEVETEADLIFNGHFHQCLGIKKINNTYFVRLGSLSRDSVTLKDHQPRLLFVSIENSKLKLNTVKIPVKEDVWISDERVENKGIDFKEFVEMLKESKVKVFDIYQTIIDVGEKSGFKNSAINKALEIVSEIE